MILFLNNSFNNNIEICIRICPCLSCLENLNASFLWFKMLKQYVFYSAAMIMVGAIIYGSGDRDKVQWSFWMAFCAAILAMINGIIWSITLKLDRYFNKGGSAVKTQGWGLTKQSDGLGGGSVGTVFTGNLGGGAIDGNLNGSGGGSLGDNLGSNDFGNLAGLEGGILDDNLGKKDLGVDIGENIGGNIGSKGPDALGGDLGSGPLGGDLGNDGLGGDKQSEIFGDGIKNVSVDINTSNLGSVGSDNALGVGLESRTLESISLGSSDALALDPDLNGTDPIIIDELKSAPIDPILQAELTTVPKDITNVTHKPLESGQASSVTDSPLSQLPLTVGSNIDLIKGVDTAGLDISEPHDNLGI